MSGHSKWSSIKHKKGAADAKRGKLFTKLARAITIAARDGGGSPEGNPELALAIQKARDASMPKDNIQRAIDRGGGKDAEALEEIRYEGTGYGPGGAAILVEVLTDNRNRTGSEIRHAFDRHGGSLGEPGSVAWQFDKRGVLTVDGSEYGEDDVMPAIDAGAEDVSVDGDLIRVITDPADATEVREVLTGSGVEVRSTELSMEPQSTVEVDREDAARLLKLMDALEDHDDVDQVHSNFDVPEKVLEELAVD